MAAKTCKLRSADVTIHNATSMTNKTAPPSFATCCYLNSTDHCYFPQCVWSQENQVTALF